jgi:hypothetical protein
MFHEDLEPELNLEPLRFREFLLALRGGWRRFEKWIVLEREQLRRDVTRELPARVL